MRIRSSHRRWLVGHEEQARSDGPKQLKTPSPTEVMTDAVVGTRRKTSSFNLKLKFPVSGPRLLCIRKQKKATSQAIA